MSKAYLLLYDSLHRKNNDTLFPSFSSVCKKNRTRIRVYSRSAPTDTHIGCRHMMIPFRSPRLALPQGFVISGLCCLGALLNCIDSKPGGEAADQLGGVRAELPPIQAQHGQQSQWL